MTDEVDPAAGSPDSDDALVESFLQGDSTAFDRLVERHQELVLRIVRRYSRDADDARDLSQRTFVRAFEAARRTFQRSFQSSGAERAPFQRWLVRIAVNLCHNHARDSQRWTRASVDRAAERPHEGPDAISALVTSERAARVRRAILDLPARQREVITLRLDAELPFAEIAAALEITENAAKVSFHHGAKRLREVVREREE